MSRNNQTSKNHKDYCHFGDNCRNYTPTSNDCWRFHPTLESFNTWRNRIDSFGSKPLGSKPLYYFDPAPVHSPPLKNNIGPLRSKRTSYNPFPNSRLPSRDERRARANPYPTYTRNPPKRVIKCPQYFWDECKKGFMCHLIHDPSVLDDLDERLEARYGFNNPTKRSPLKIDLDAIRAKRALKIELNTKSSIFSPRSFPRQMDRETTDEVEPTVEPADEPTDEPRVVQFSTIVNTRIIPHRPIVNTEPIARRTRSRAVKI